MNELIILWTITVASIVSTVTGIEQPNYNETLDIENEQPKLLSRRKRFLIFPDGSSLQLVFETQNHGYLQIGNIVWFSNTAALAWELPADPKLFNILKKESRFYGPNANRREDNKHIYFLDEDGKVLSKVPYHRKFIVNPAMGKRSIEGEAPRDNDPGKGISIKDMHGKEKQRNYFRKLDQERIDFHRSNREELYEKLETVLTGMGWNGSECVLQMLCEAGKPNDSQGTFLEEIVRATFTLPRGRGVDSRHKYDVAHGTLGDCALMYPDCSMSVMENE